MNGLASPTLAEGKPLVVTRDMDTWPQIKTARQLVEQGIIPVSENKLRAIARQYGIGRMIGRTLIFNPEDIASLLKVLPCPSNSHGDMARPIGTFAAPSEDSMLTRALALATEKPRRTSSSKERRN